MKQPKSLKDVYIPRPCHENWDTMSPREQGRHCFSCNKTVVDFTEMEEQEILAILSKGKGQVCGRIYADRINQDLKYELAEPLQFWSYARQKFLTWVVMAGIKFFTAGSLFAQSTQSVSYSLFGRGVSINWSDVQEKRKEEGNRKIFGKVISNDKDTAEVRSISGVSIRIKDSHGNVVAEEETDAKGMFNVILPDTVNLNQSFLLIATKEDYKNRRVKVSFGRQSILLKEEDFQKEQVLAIKWKKKKRSSLFRKRVAVAGYIRFR